MSNTATFNTSPNLKLSKKLSFGEEVANSVTHAVGAMAMLVLLPITAVHANNGCGMTAPYSSGLFDSSADAGTAPETEEDEESFSLRASSSTASGVAGRRKRTVVPRSGPSVSDVMRTLPPCASVTLSTMARPSPVPWLLVVK